MGFRTCTTLHSHCAYINGTSHTGAFVCLRINGTSRRSAGLPHNHRSPTPIPPTVADERSGVRRSRNRRANRPPAGWWRLPGQPARRGRRARAPVISASSTRPGGCARAAAIGRLIGWRWRNGSSSTSRGRRLCRFLPPASTRPSPSRRRPGHAAHAPMTPCPPPRDERRDRLGDERALGAASATRPCRGRAPPRSGLVLRHRGRLEHDALARARRDGGARAARRGGAVAAGAPRRRRPGPPSADRRGGGAPRARRARAQRARRPPRARRRCVAPHRDPHRAERVIARPRRPPRARPARARARRRRSGGVGGGGGRAAPPPSPTPRRGRARTRWARPRLRACAAA